MQAGICRFNIAKKLSHYSDGFGLEHPAVKASLTGTPEEEIRCPACGKVCELFYQQFGRILGCDRCIREREAWELLEELKYG